MPMSAEDPQGNTWGHCPRGAVAEVVRQRKARHARTNTRRVAVLSGATLSVLLAAGIGIWAMSDQQPNIAPVESPARQVQAISCSETLESLDGYLANNLSEDLELRIDEHMRKCPRCRRHIPEGHPKTGLVAALLPAISRELWAITLADTTLADTLANTR